MDLALYILKSTILTLLDVMEIAMFVRAILSWFDPEGEGALSSFLFVITEPLVLPFRKLCEKMHWFEGSPLDFPFLFTVLMLAVVSTLLEVFA